MKKIRLLIENPFVIVLLLAVFVNYSFTSPANRISVKNLSGEDLFKSIYYADGNITGEIESLEEISKIVKSFDKKELEEYRLEQNKVIDFLKTKDADFFNDFKETVQTKDAKSIEAYFDYSNNLIKDYVKMETQKKGVDIEKLVKEYKNDLSLNDNSTNSPKSVALVFLVTIVLVIGIAIAATMTKTKVSDPMEPSGPVIMASVSYQKFISEIASLS
ncbi:hypothetical protein ACF3NR_02365 [Vaginella massiliensis]|uniref:hypothetical protein n=1 Tax=Vaginella massiliensis TaxID=1816680 RepID=UPI003752DEF3